MNKVIDKLKEEHCDVDTALNRCMDMEDLYLELLQIFVDDKVIDLLEEAYQEGDVEQVFFQAHTLKGVYSNLGMTPLFDLNTPIVETSRGKNLDGVGEAIQSLKKEHNRFVSMIKEYL